MKPPFRVFSHIFYLRFLGTPDSFLGCFSFMCFYDNYNFSYWGLDFAILLCYNINTRQAAMSLEVICFEAVESSALIRSREVGCDLGIWTLQSIGVEGTQWSYKPEPQVQILDVVLLDKYERLFVNARGRCFNFLEKYNII